jgi:hypothetical protein
MHRVELKAPNGLSTFLGHASFLMHRVELKASRRGGGTPLQVSTVPNAPCGVESAMFERFLNRVELRSVCKVPNAPCGVESEKQRHSLRPFKLVPNAPCGVESLFAQ